MTLEEIQKRVDEIRNIAYDSESAHVEEDGLRHDFIQFISELDNKELAQKAILVLSTDLIDFNRWCA